MTAFQVLSNREIGHSDLITSLWGKHLPGPNGLFVVIEIVDQVNFASGVDGYLIARTDTKTRVISRAKVHDGLASSGIGLLVEGARDRETVRNAGL